MKTIARQLFLFVPVHFGTNDKVLCIASHNLVPERDGTTYEISIEHINFYSYWSYSLLICFILLQFPVCPWLYLNVSLFYSLAFLILWN